MLALSDDWPLRRTLWQLSLKKLSIRFKRLPEIRIDSSLYSKPLCQTLSKAFEISKNTALVSRVGLQSNVEKIWVISINWLKIDWPKSNSLCQAWHDEACCLALVVSKIGANRDYHNLATILWRDFFWNWICVWNCVKLSLFTFQLG